MEHDRIRVAIQCLLAEGLLKDKVIVPSPLSPDQDAHTSMDELMGTASFSVWGVLQDFP